MKFTIGRKLTVGFSAMIVFFIISIFISNLTLRQSQRVNDMTGNLYVPSMMMLMEFNNMIIESEKLIGTWIFIQSTDDTEDKNRLRQLINNDYPLLKSEILEKSVLWEQAQQDTLSQLFDKVDRLFADHSLVMNSLIDFASYEDPMLFFEIRPMMEQGGSIVTMTSEIADQLAAMIAVQQQNVSDGQTRLNAALESFGRFSIMAGLAVIIGGLLIAAIIIRLIARPVTSIRNILNFMGQGKLPDEEIKTGNDEIGDMAKALNFLITGLKEKAEFATEIGKGNFEYTYNPLSQDDTLGLALVEMRQSLLYAKSEEEKRKIEDDKRNWATQGLAMFAELLRQNNDDMKELSFSIIKNLVKYLGANQGGVFILNDEANGERYAELTACYAYERRKFIQKKIMVGEGLVGTCLQEGETIFISEVPDGYISITSGLGESNPRCILIVPLKLNDMIFGIIELASFEVFEPYKIEFVERIGESIASTISSVKTNIRTTELLHQSQEQSEEMRAQEEEMRQNMEEMHATQEEMERKEVESQEFFGAINATIPFAEFSIDCKILKLSPKFSLISGFPQAGLESESIFKIIDKHHLEKDGSIDLADIFLKGESLNREFKINKPHGGSLLAKGSLRPIVNKFGAPIKVVFIIQEIITAV